MGAFLAYFDLLGYKNFIEGNKDDLETLHRRVGHVARNAERALSLEHPAVNSPYSRIDLNYDISHSTLDCVIFSDTVVFITAGNTLNDFKEILSVAYKYNWFNVLDDFPSRGCLVYGDIWVRPFDKKNERSGHYMANMVYGKALVDAHLKAEAMSWAGCILDQSAIDYAQSLGDIDTILDYHTMSYEVPYKRKADGIEIEVKVRERAMKLLQGNAVVTHYIADGIRRAFTGDNKGEIVGRTKVIFDNTIEFMKAHGTLPFYYLADRSVGERLIHVFGKLDANDMHTTITREKYGDQPITYRINEVRMVWEDRPDLGFTLEKPITFNEFEEQLNHCRL